MRQTERSFLVMYNGVWALDPYNLTLTRPTFDSISHISFQSYHSSMLYETGTTQLCKKIHLQLHQAVGHLRIRLRPSIYKW